MNKTVRLLLTGLLWIVLLLNGVSTVAKSNIPEFSKAGFWELKDSGREVFNFNLGWRFLKGDAEGAYLLAFDDSKWSVVNCPHGLEYLPAEASGGINYQGPAWYRKHFLLPDSLLRKELKLYFEAVMGKCKIFLNGELLGEHYGGYLPFVIDLTGKVKAAEDNVLAVWTDNSDDPTFPPGKPQARLDFAYFGGIYRDVWLVATNRIYVTNPNEVDKIAGGGIFTHLVTLTNERAELMVDVDIQNDFSTSHKIQAELTLYDPDGMKVQQKNVGVHIKGGKSMKVSSLLIVSDPKLWTPDTPFLYRLEVRLRDEYGGTLDGVALNTGVRKIEFRGRDGFYLNNRPFPGKLIGVNRHQDHAYVGNALPNNGQWRDAVLLKNAGCNIIRAAHYPADPAFMDACDALGIFFIVATPGWQFWNNDPVFEQRVFKDIRNMVRRDRNRPSVIMWEPILNETPYPGGFAKKTHDLVHEEYPYQGAYTACDAKADGQEYFDVVYAHDFNVDFQTETRCTFTREFGDNVDDFNAQNSSSRAARAWGEQAQLKQALHYANEEPWSETSLESLYRTPRQHVGGTLWCGFDHQRAYHPDPFYGGLTDVFRQPKYSYYLFASQRNVSKTVEPMVYVAHEMTPFSPSDVTVFTNCEEVRLTLHNGQKIIQKLAVPAETRLELIKRGQPKKRVRYPLLKMPHPVVTFENAYDFMDTKQMHRSGRKKESSMLVEGLIDGKVVASYRKTAAKRPTRLLLTIEDKGLPLVADGSDFILLVASVVDEDGVVKHLNENSVQFSVEGEGQIIGDESTGANPCRLSWGTAPLLLRATNRPGKIKVSAELVHEGINSPLPAQLELESIPSNDRFIFSEIGSEPVAQHGPRVKAGENSSFQELQAKVRALEKELNRLKLREEEHNQLEYDMNR